MSGKRLKLYFYILLLCACQNVLATSQQTSINSRANSDNIIEINIDETDFSITTYPGKTEHLLIWFAPGHGFNKRHYQLAKQLAHSGIGSWLVDISEALFLPRGTASIRQIEGHYGAKIIRLAHQRTKKTITLVSSSYGAITALRAAHQWQRSNPGQSYLGGAILFSPNTYQAIPALGSEPEYLPVTRATSIPLFILQSSKNSNRWQLDTLVNNLQQGGSQVYKKLMPGVTALFYEEDQAPQTLKTLTQLPALFTRVVPLLRQTPKPVLVPLASSSSSSGKTGVDNSLVAYRGKITPRVIDLYDANDRHYVFNDYRGKLTLVNFWATWCTPCIREIPSLNRLREKMHNPSFELVSINYAQEPGEIKDFLRQVKVDFPVLVDPDGRVTADWNVIAFPSTFVIGPDGKIKYGVNAAIEWDTPEVIKQLQNLLRK